MVTWELSIAKRRGGGGDGGLGREEMQCPVTTSRYMLVVPPQPLIFLWVYFLLSAKARLLLVV